MAHITGTEVGYSIGSTEWAQLTDSDASTQTHLLALATSIVDAALKKRGYTPPTSAGNLVKTATLGALLPMLYGRKGLAVPEQLQVHIAVFNKIADDKDGLPPDDLVPAADAGIGGVEFTESSTSVSGAKTKVFGNLRGTF